MSIELDTKQNFFPHDNGGRPYMVSIDTKKVSVYQRDEDFVFDDEEHIKTFKEAQDPKFYAKLVFELDSYSKIWVPDDPQFKDDYGQGNSILIEKSPCSYIYVGHSIFSFKTLEPIVDYVSHVGNSDVPYPWAKDKKGRIYLMLQKVSFVLKEKEDEEDPYRLYYFERQGREKKKSKKLEKLWDEEHAVQDMTVEIIVDTWIAQQRNKRKK